MKKHKGRFNFILDAIPLGTTTSQLAVELRMMTQRQPFAQKVREVVGSDG